MSLDPAYAQIVIHVILYCVSAFFVFVTKMPVFALHTAVIMISKSPLSFHHLLLNKPSLLKQVRILFNSVHIYMGYHLGIVAEQHTIGRPSYT